MGVEALLALGGNLGDVREAFASARACLEAESGLRLLDCSRLYRSAAVGVPGQPDYLNAVLALQVEIGAPELLRRLQAIEDAHGRVRGPERWGARTLDLDLLAYDDTCMQSEALILPHPRLHERMFVLQPLCDIRPHWHHPVLGRTAVELMRDLTARGFPSLPAGLKW